MTLPTRDLVAGQVQDVSTISRKGLGSYYELTLQTDGGEPDRVLMARDVAGEGAVHSLIGHHISAHVTSSSVATDLEIEGDPGFDATAVRRSAQSATAHYDFLALIFAGAGIAIGLFMLAILGKGLAK